MKKIFMLIAGALLSLGLANAQSVESRTVNGPEKTMVNVLACNYDFPVETVKAAVLERMEKEGLKGKKAKNNFFSFIGVKYNPLWNNNFDLYVGFAGSKSAGSVQVLMATGYNNYIDLQDPETKKRVSAWLKELDLDIQNYVHNQKIENAQKALDKTKKEINKLNKEERSLESKIEKNKDNINKAKAQQTVASGPNAISVDQKQVAKDEKALKKLENERVKLERSLADNQKELKKAKETMDDQEKELSDLKANRPK